jgi:hypothetical protein
MSNTKQKAISFMPSMAQAVAEGRKTQTRRVVKPQPSPCNHSIYFEAEWKNEPPDFIVRQEEVYCRLCGNRVNQIPYAPGDILWVRENYYQYGYWIMAGTTKTGKQKMRFVPKSEDIRFVPPDGYRISMDKENPSWPCWYKRLGRFMPRKYSRITLEVVSVRCERLGEISEGDAIAEGIDIKVSQIADTGDSCSYPRNYMVSEKEADGWPYLKEERYIESFQSLWQSIHGEWNPDLWVWVYEFKVKEVKP